MGYETPKNPYKDIEEMKLRNPDTTIKKAIAKKDISGNKLPEKKGRALKKERVFQEDNCPQCLLGKSAMDGHCLACKEAKHDKRIDIGNNMPKDI